MNHSRFWQLVRSVRSTIFLVMCCMTIPTLPGARRWLAAHRGEAHGTCWTRIQNRSDVGCILTFWTRSWFLWSKMATNYLKTENQTAALSCAEAQWLLSSFEAPPFLDLFYLRHRSASDDKIQHVYTGVFSSGSRRHLPPEVGVRFSVIFSGHPGHPGHPRRSDRSCDACFAPTIQPRQVRSLGKECRFRRKKMNPAPGLKIEILQDSSFWKTAIDRHSLWGCRLQHRYNPVARLG